MKPAPLLPGDGPHAIPPVLPRWRRLRAAHKRAVASAVAAERARWMAAAGDLEKGATVVHRVAIATSRGRQTPDVLLAAATVATCKAVARGARR